MNPLTARLTASSARAKRFMLALLGRHSTHITMGCGILLLDWMTGPYVLFPIFFVIPVFLCCWFCSVRLAYILAGMLPLGRFCIARFVEGDGPFPTPYLVGNGLIEASGLGLLAFLVSNILRQARQIRRLQGLLPICMYCKRIRDKNQHWHPLEVYISDHSEAQFSHGICPECEKTYFQDLFGSKPGT